MCDFSPKISFFNIRSIKNKKNEDDGDDEAIDDDEDPADEEEQVTIPQTGDQNYYLYLFIISSLMALAAVKVKKSDA